MLSAKTILHPTDFSWRSEYAFQLACVLARQLGARLVALHVVPPPPPPIIAYHGPGISPEQSAVSRDSLLAALHKLDAADAGVRVEPRLEDGDPAAAIIRVAEELPSDLIVMGTQGRTGLGRLLLGSVAEQVMRRAPCPVVIAKVPQPEPPPS